MPKANDDAGRMAPGGGDSRLRWYPPSWRARYGDELVALLDDEYGSRLPFLVHLSLASGGLRQRARHSGLMGDSASVADRIRAAALMVLGAWTAFVIAGASFAKYSEHFDAALPHRDGAHRVPDLAFTVLQIVAGVAGVLVVTGAVLALPSMVRFVRTGGWTSLRAHVVRAVSCTAFAVTTTVVLVVWAHHLTAHQRNGGIHWYGLLFVVWAGLLLITLTLWTVAAVAAGRRIEFSTALLRTEATLSGAVAVAMVVMVGATAVWWGAMAKEAPSFVNTSTGGFGANVWLTGTVLLMIAATVAAVVGVARELRVRTQLWSTQ